MHIIIQARMTSTRLPRKVMLPLCGKTVLEVLVDRIKKYKDNIIIATTNDGSEEPIVNLCKKSNIKYFQGSMDNVLERYYLSAKEFGAGNKDVIVRITSDCPLIDVSILERVVSFFKEGGYDYASNRIDRTVPVGLDVEVFNFSVLKDAYKKATLGYEREHVTPYIYLTKKDKYRIGSFLDATDNSKYRLTLDEESDYLAIKEVYRKFNNRTNFDYDSLIKMLESNSYIYDINSNVCQKQVV